MVSCDAYLNLVSSEMLSEKFKRRTDVTYLDKQSRWSLRRHHLARVTYLTSYERRLSVAAIVYIPLSEDEQARFLLPVLVYRELS